VILGTTSPLLWYSTRATAVVGLVLLTISAVLGITTATRLGSNFWPRFASAELHRRASIMAMVFIGLHIVTTVADSYVSVPVLAAVVPFTSPYSPWSVGLGTIAFDLLLVVLLSSLIRHRIPATWWRGLHYLVYLSAPIAFLHVLTLGTDARRGSHWLLGVLAACLGVCAVALFGRLWSLRHRVGHKTMPPKKPLLSSNRPSRSRP